MDLRLLQSDVARRIGVSEATVWGWEADGREPEIRHVPALIAFLGRDPRPSPQTVGERLVWFRVGKGWARPRLAKELGVDPSTLARWETGEREPWGDYVCRVEKLLRLGS